MAGPAADRYFGIFFFFFFNGGSGPAGDRYFDDWVWIPKQNEAQSARAESTHKRVNQRSKYVTQIQQQRPELPTVTLTWHACKYLVHKLGCTSGGVYVLVLTRMPGENYRRWLRSLLLYLRYVFRAQINSLVCWVWNVSSLVKYT